MKYGQSPIQATGRGLVLALEEMHFLNFACPTSTHTRTSSQHVWMERGKRKSRQSLVDQAVNTALIPILPLLSRPAQRAYLGTALFALTSFLLLGLASIAFWLFYYEYVPQPGVERVVHLQFGNGHPHGTTEFGTNLVSNQAYDVSLLLDLPLTPDNVDAGNFMLSLSLLPSGSKASLVQSIAPPSMQQNHSTIVHARRPAILTYSTPLTFTASTLANLPLYVFGLRRESEELIVPMFEGVEFAKGASNVPRVASVVVEAEKMQFYSVRLRIIAKLSGLRWILYNHRLLSFSVFTTAFWASSMFSMALVWLILTLYLDSDGDKDGRKAGNRGKELASKSEPSSEGGHEEPELSDTNRIFPSLGRQKPLKYEGPSIKQEEGEASVQSMIRPLEIAAAEADDETDLKDEEGGSSTFRDSGIGTGREEGISRGAQRRRKGSFRDLD